MNEDNYLTADELRGIAKAIESLQPLWELITEGPINGISFTDEAQTTCLDAYDFNGDKVGYISWSESGPAFYLSSEEKPVSPDSTPRGVWRLDDNECGRCHSIGTIIGYAFFDEKGNHQHTHYVCTYWESGHEEGGSGDTGRCGWHGWRADEHAKWE